MSGFVRLALGKHGESEADFVYLLVFQLTAFWHYGNSFHMRQDLKSKNTLENHSKSWEEFVIYNRQAKMKQFEEFLSAFPFI